MGFKSFFMEKGFRQALLDRDPYIKQKAALMYFFHVASHLKEINDMNPDWTKRFETLSEEEKINLREKFLNISMRIKYPSYDDIEDIDDKKTLENVWKKLFGVFFFYSRIENEATSFVKFKFENRIPFEDKLRIYQAAQIFRGEKVEDTELLEVFNYLKKVIK